jgi:cyclic pyranopterin phosphate synthase
MSTFRWPTCWPAFDAAHAAGLGPIKVNMVVKRGTNDQEIEPMARFFRQHFDGRIVLRFIEYMDVGASNGWRMDEVLPSAAVLQRLQAAFPDTPLRPLDPTVPGETAERWGFADGRGEIGLISSVTQAFCRDCNRARLSTEGKLFLCLFATRGHDLRSPAAQRRRRRRHHQRAGGRVGRAPTTAIPNCAPPSRPRRAGGERRVEMHYIGG